MFIFVVLSKKTLYHLRGIQSFEDKIELGSL